MHQVLLVDDEYYALQGLQSGVNWEKFRIDSIHLANNIRQAKEVIDKHPIDFLICDIEMPEGSGIELLTWVREHYPSIEWVFLTCHINFGFAQQAIQLGSLDYLLKPVCFEELESVIQKAMDKVEKRQQEDEVKKNYDHYYTLWKKQQPLIIERFWLDLLNRTLSSNPLDIGNTLLLRNIPLTEHMQFKPILINVQRWRRELSPRDTKIMEYAMRNAAAYSLIPDHDMGQVIPLNGGLLLAILPHTESGLDEKSVLREKCRSYIQFCNQYICCDLSCYIGQPVHLHEMIDMIEKLSIFRKNNVINVNCEFFIEDYPVSDEVARGPRMIEIPLMNDWTELLKQGEWSRLLLEVKTFLEKIKSDEKANARMLQLFYQDFIQMVYYVLHLKGVMAHQIFSDQLSPEQAISVTSSVVELNEWVEHIIEIVATNLDEREETQTIVEKVKRFIAENIDQPLMRKDIANHVYLNPDYLAKLFRKKNGLALSDYIVNERMKLAKSMLEHTGASIGHVASSVGYSSFSHFSKTFKGKFGMTPQEFRTELQN
jgi:two-component system response regulator YesN